MGGHLGERKALPTESLHGAWLDDIIAGQRDHSAINGGNVHGTATQRLGKMRQRVRKRWDRVTRKREKD